MIARRRSISWLATTSSGALLGLALSIGCELVGDLGDDDVEQTEGGDGMCQLADCDPAPAIAMICDDGSTADWVCEANADGSACEGRQVCPEPCMPADCGPQPAIGGVCPDDSDATAICERDAVGTCDWRLECPPASCTPQMCGPAPGAPNFECPDGTTGGPACLPSNEGCVWQFIECPDEPTCMPDDCGEAPGAPNFECPDGTLGGPACVPTGEAMCGWVDIACPPVCDEAACGPAPGVPSEVCEDGTIAGPTCLPTEGACMWVIVEC